MQWRQQRRGAEQWKTDHYYHASFYGSISAAMLLDLALNFVGFNAVEMLIYSAVLHGLLAQPLILLVVLLTSKSERLKRRGKVSENPNKEKGNGYPARHAAALNPIQALRYE